MLMKKIYLLLMALLVSCLYTPQAQADNPVSVTMSNDNIADNSEYNLSANIATISSTGRTFKFATQPQIVVQVKTGKYVMSSSTMTVNKNGSLTVSLADQSKMTKIELIGYSNTATIANQKPSVSSGGGTFSNGIWEYTDGSTSVTIQAANATRGPFSFKGVKITLAGGGGEEPTPTLALDNTYPFKTKIDASYTDFTTLPDNAYTGEIKLTGSNLTADVTATSSDPAILSITPQSCTKKQAEAGQIFTFSFKPTATTDAPTITFSSGDAGKIVVTSTAEGATLPQPSSECANIQDLKDLANDSKATYTGSTDSYALVTYISGQFIYLQDDSGAIRLSPSTTDITGLAVGNKLKNLSIYKNSDGLYNLTAFTVADNTVEDGTVFPVDAKPVTTPTELTKDINQYRFVKVQYGMFDNAGVALPQAGQAFNIPESTIAITVAPFSNATAKFSGWTTPAAVCSVAGICEPAPNTTGSVYIYTGTPDDITFDFTDIPKLTFEPSTVVINSGDAEDALSTSFSISGTNITNNVTLSTANAGISFPTTELDAATVAAGTTAELNWVPSQVTAGSAIVKATTTFSYAEKTFTVATDIPVTVMGAPTFTYKAVMSGTEPTETTQVVIGGQMPVNKTIIVSATNLMGDINIVCQPGITATPATITMADHAAADTEVILTVDADESDFTKYVYFETAGLKNTSAYLTVLGKNAIPLTRVSTVKAIRDAQAAYATVVFNGEAIVTYTDANGFYMQDETAGIYVRYQDYTHPNQGDKLTDVRLKYYDITGFLVGWTLDSSDFTKSATGQTVEPTVVEADQLGDQYADMLVKVEEIKLTPVEGQTTFTAGNTYSGTSPTGQVSVSPFAGDIAGTEIPTKYVDVTGIYATLSGDSRALRPRTLADITESAVQNPLVTFITPSTTDYASTVVPHAERENVDMAEFTCQFFNLPEGSHAVVTYEPAGADIKLNKADAEATEAAADYLLTDGKYTLKLAAYAPAVGFYRNISVKFIFGTEETADNTREFTFLPLKVWNAGIDDTATLTSNDFEEGETDTFKLVQNEYNSVTVTLTVTLANCYDAIVVTNPVQHPYGIEENTMILSLADAEQPVQPTALEDGDSDAEQAPLVLYPGEGGNGEYNLKLTMNCQYKFDTATPLTYTFVRQGDPNQQPLATLTVNYEANDVETGIDGIATDSTLYRVYSLQGILLLDGVRAERVAELPAGLYIVNGKKVNIRK